MSKEIKVALFVIVVAAIFIFGLNFLKGKGFFDDNSRYFAIFEQVGGMYKSDPIVVNGYQIGKMGLLIFIFKVKQFIDVIHRNAQLVC